MPKTAEPWSQTNLREKLITIGAKVVSHSRYVTFQLAKVAVSRRMFQGIPPTADAVRASMTGRSGRMRQVATAEMYLEYCKAVSSGMSSEQFRSWRRIPLRRNLQGRRIRSNDLGSRERRLIVYLTNCNGVSLGPLIRPQRGLAEDAHWPGEARPTPGGREMPTSAIIFDDIVKAMIQLTAPRVVLDIGPGVGKYGHIIKSIELETNCVIQKICVEVENENVIQRFMLHELYDEILHEDAAVLPKRYPMLTGDIVVAGDVIEHLTKSEGIDLIEYLQYRFRHIFLVIPVNWISLSWEDYGHESHVSIWRIKDIENFEGGYCVERLTESGDRFLLGSVNGIRVPVKDHFVVRDKIMNTQPKPVGTEIEFGFLHRQPE